MSVNKPTKQTISDLRSASESIAFVLRFTPQADRHATLTDARSKIEAALSQLTLDEQLKCEHCHAVKPTRRALAAHVATAHGRKS